MKLPTIKVNLVTIVKMIVNFKKRRRERILKKVDYDTMHEGERNR